MRSIAAKTATAACPLMATAGFRQRILRSRSLRKAVDRDVLDRRRQQPLNAAQQIAIRR